MRGYRRFSTGAALAAAAGTARFSACRLESRRYNSFENLRFEATVAVVLFAPSSVPLERSPEGLAALIEREWAVLDLLAAGLGYKQIADWLGLSE